jgi:hypothetical protein
MYRTRAYQVGSREARKARKARKAARRMGGYKERATASRIGIKITRKNASSRRNGDCSGRNGDYRGRNGNYRGTSDSKGQ